jgi:hypothetical protein
MTKLPASVAVIVSPDDMHRPPFDVSIGRISDRRRTFLEAGVTS